jgi:hypothetical protein
MDFKIPVGGILCGYRGYLNLCVSHVLRITVNDGSWPLDIDLLMEQLAVPERHQR